MQNKHEKEIFDKIQIREKELRIDYKHKLSEILNKVQNKEMIF